MGIDPSRIRPSNTTFKGVIIPYVEARFSGTLTLEVVFGSPDNFRNKDLIFDIVPFRIGYHALLGRTALARFNVVPHYTFLKLKMPGPKGVITVNGNTEHSARTEEDMAGLAAEVQTSIEGPKYQPTVKAREASKRARALSPFKESPYAQHK
ncbi:uncharacterized protein [Aegilops tauschii subsp. strangulata]|uniref:uncharacterized protein n=1 Tax=Aegilops tauschii subsp. strangulata TaxID=200361 RepID=UPI003CC87BC5